VTRDAGVVRVGVRCPRMVDANGVIAGAAVAGRRECGAEAGVQVRGVSSVGVTGMYFVAVAANVACAL
jgi:hypothetical protein